MRPKKLRGTTMKGSVSTKTRKRHSKCNHSYGEMWCLDATRTRIARIGVCWKCQKVKQSSPRFPVVFTTNKKSSNFWQDRLSMQQNVAVRSIGVVHLCQKSIARNTVCDHARNAITDTTIMPRGVYPRTSGFCQKMQQIATEATSLWPYKSYICSICGGEFESKSHHMPNVCKNEVCQRSYYRDKLREWRARQ